MIKYVLKRLLMMIPVMLGVLTIAFILNELTPGDAATALAGSEATEEQVEAIREELGLNAPVLVRYGRYVWGLFTRADMGTSYTTNQPVLDEILARYPTTLKLAFLSVAVAVLIGIPLGVIAAVKQYTWIDNVTMTISLLGVSMPPFWLGLLLIFVFSVTLGVLPGSGLAGGWQSWVLPVVTIGFSSAATIARVTRSSMLEVIRQDYIRTAKAKGQSSFVIVVGHGLRNAMIPIITVIGAQIGVQLGGAVLAETIFALPGLGSYMVSAIKGRNYPVVQGGVVFLSLIFSLVNLAVDLIYTVIDPSLKTMFQPKGRRAVRREMKRQLMEGDSENG